MLSLTTALLISGILTIIFLLGMYVFHFLCCYPKGGFWHHFYMGSLLFLFSASSQFYVASFGIFFALLCWLDDGYQHYRQCKDHSYQSPLHRFYAYYIWPYLDIWFEKNWPWFYKNIWHRI